MELPFFYSTIIIVKVQYMRLDLMFDSISLFLSAT